MCELSLRRWLLSSGLMVLLVPAAAAGTFSLNAWTNDASAGIVPGQTLWADHFGNTNTAVINGVTVPGTGTNENPFVPGQFKIGGLSFVFPNDSNNLTALGGDGSAVLAKSFLYGGAPRLITIEGLATGQVYTVSIYGVGFDAPAVRASYFTNGTDTLYVDENSAGNDAGLRVDYSFTATATTNLTTIMATNANSFHVYGLALRQPLLVTTTSNAGPGSLRQAVLDAGTFPGPDIITFAPALAGATITLGSQIVISNTVTIDATSVPGLTVSGGNGTRIFLVNASTTFSVNSLTMRDGYAPTGPYPNNCGGAILNSGTVTLNACTLLNNRAMQGSEPGGGGIENTPGGVLRINHSTFAGNATGGYGGGIENYSGTLIVNHATLASNSASFSGGGISLVGSTAITNSIVAGNTAPSFPNLAGEPFSGANNLLAGDPRLAPPGYYGGATPTLPPGPGSPAIDAAAGSASTTDQRGFKRPSGSAADIGAVEVQLDIQNVIYDGFGFETPRFALGSITGQDAVNGPWLQSGSGTGSVQATNVAGSAQAVRLDRTGADVYFAVVKTITNVGATTTPIIAVDWSMNYQPAGLPLGSFGPYFGVSVFDHTGVTPLLTASAGVDATTAELVYQSPATGFITAVPGIVVPPNSWHTYRLELDYVAQTYRLIYGGNEVLAKSFVDPGATNFTDASIMAIAAASDPASLNASGTVFFDNYKLTALATISPKLAIAPAGAGQVTLSWTPATPASILIEASGLSATNWMFAPSTSTNPITVPTTSNKFYRLYKP